MWQAKQRLLWHGEKLFSKEHDTQYTVHHVLCKVYIFAKELFLPFSVRVICMQSMKDGECCFQYSCNLDLGVLEYSWNLDLGVLGIDAIKPGICKEACVASGFERKLEKTKFQNESEFKGKPLDVRSMKTQKWKWKRKWGLPLKGSFWSRNIRETWIW